MNRTPHWLKASRVAERAPMDGARLGAQEIPLAQMRTDDGGAGTWRITLSRIDRKDQAAPLAKGDTANSSPAWISQLYQFAAGEQRTPAIPPRRTNPIYGNHPGNGDDVEPLFVEVVWGMRDAAANRMIANWPMLGASIILTGSYVEVFAAGAVFAKGDPPISAGEYPVFEAQISPDDGSTVTDSGELSLAQNTSVEDYVPEVIATLDTSALMIPIVTAGPMTDVWAAVLTFGDASGQTFSIGYGGAAGVEARYGEDFSTGAWLPLVGNVGVRVGGAAVTVADLEAAVAALLPDLLVATPDAAHALWTLDNTAILSAGGAFTDGACATQGGAVYVPDYARRVRVTLAKLDERFCGNELRVPLTGNPKAQLVWYDDQGNVVDTLLQCCPEFVPVPAAATMLAIYGVPGDVYNAIIHWRIAP